ncbi:MAG: LapA family protein [Segniliparus sp.]|uniref:LapA family protein n=1 Tax=Segniliparus sp. TaxID=2804064 RepID=UPI003F34816D
MSTESADPAANPIAPAAPAGPAAPVSLGPDSPKNAPVPAADSAPPAIAESKGKPGKKGKGTEHLDAVKHTRTGAAWTGIILGTLLLIVLLIFIVQNQEPTKVVFLSWDVSLPLGVLLLAAAIIGVLGTALVGAARMFQVWRAARKSHKA